jgi:hypothetical protein
MCRYSFDILTKMSNIANLSYHFDKFSYFMIFIQRLFMHSTIQKEMGQCMNDLTYQ